MIPVDGPLDARWVSDAKTNYKLSRCMCNLVIDGVVPSDSFLKQSLVGGAITILKNMKVNGKDYPIYHGT